MKLLLAVTLLGVALASARPQNSFLGKASYFIVLLVIKKAGDAGITVARGS
jgi:hypothetical protein